MPRVIGGSRVAQSIMATSFMTSVGYRVIVDTSALIAILRREAEANVFEALIVDAAGQARVSSGTLLETAIVVDGNRNPILSRRFDELVKELRLIVEPVTEEQARVARETYRDYGRGSGHPARLNFGDCFAYTLARTHVDPLLFKAT